MAKDHGPSVKDDKQYEGLRRKGMSKARAAAISNSPGAEKKGGKRSAKKRSSKKRSGGSSGGGSKKRTSAKRSSAKRTSSTSKKARAGRKGGKAAAKK
jgi:hypothetical protein